MAASVSRSAWVGVSVVAAAVITSCASAARPPTRAERVALKRAATTYIDLAQNHCCVHGLHATAVQSRDKVSTANPAWAVVYVRIKDSSGKDVQGALVVLHRVGTTWRVKQEGNVLLGCGVPAGVRKDLGLTVPPNGCR